MTKISALDTAEITIRRARFGKYVKGVMVACGVICIAAGARAAVSSHSDPARSAPAAAIAVANVTTTPASDDLGNPAAHKRAVTDGVATDGRQLATEALRDGAHPRTLPRSAIAAKKPGRH